jgi:hypothetical protein
VISAVPSERRIFTLNSAIAAVSEGNFGRLGANQQQFYMRGNALSQLDPDGRCQVRCRRSCRARTSGRISTGC